MSRIYSGQLLVPSILDRLLDDHPEENQELPASRTQRLRELKQSVRRDLEYLLNTRVCLHIIPEDLEELWTSVFNYGIPDFGGLASSSLEQQDTLRSKVEDVIRRFETRFKYVHVELIRDDTQSLHRTIRLKIDGVLHAEPAPEPVSFDSQVIPSVGIFKIKGDLS